MQAFLAWQRCTFILIDDWLAHLATHAVDEAEVMGFIPRRPETSLYYVAQDTPLTPASWLANVFSW